MANVMLFKKKTFSKLFCFKMQSNNQTDNLPKEHQTGFVDMLFLISLILPYLIQFPTKHLFLSVLKYNEENQSVNVTKRFKKICRPQVYLFPLSKVVQQFFIMGLSSNKPLILRINLL